MTVRSVKILMLNCRWSILPDSDRGSIIPVVLERNRGLTNQLDKDQVNSRYSNFYTVSRLFSRLLLTHCLTLFIPSTVCTLVIDITTRVFYSEYRWHVDQFSASRN